MLGDLRPGWDGWRPGIARRRAGKRIARRNEAWNEVAPRRMRCFHSARLVLARAGDSARENAEATGESVLPVGGARREFSPECSAQSRGTNRRGGCRIAQ